MHNTLSLNNYRVLKRLFPIIFCSTVYIFSFFFMCSFVSLSDYFKSLDKKGIWPHVYAVVSAEAPLQIMGLFVGLYLCHADILQNQARGPRVVLQEKELSQTMECLL